MIFAWACRLGTFLFIRVLKDGHDKRFDKVRDDPARFFVFWSIQASDNYYEKCIFYKILFLQGVWVWVTLLPTLLLNTERRDPVLGNRDYIGYSLWLVGFLFEVVADMQKSIFRANPDNDVRDSMLYQYHLSINIVQGKFISSGLWAISRHPNYFGEILLWFGLYISGSSVFRGYQYLSVVSPVFVGLLITKLSGKRIFAFLV